MGQLQERYKSYRIPQKYMAEGVYPYFREITSKQGTEVEMAGHKVLMFGSNAYTGLTGDQRIIDAAKKALDKYGSGCAGSRFLNGTLDLHVQLEKELAEYIGKDETLCFSTGFFVNSGVLAVVVGRGDYIICDDRDHASIVDGRRLSFARQLHYKHNDMEDLENILKGLPHEAVKLIVVDGVFSMEGDLRRSRAGAQNIVPNSTGAAKAIGLVIPELNGKLIGSAQRVPTPTGSTTILVAVVKGKDVTVEGINAAMKAASNESFGYNEDLIVSSDIIGMRYGSLFDATQTMVSKIDDDTYQVQVVSWYDNENSYTSQMVRTIKYLAELK